MRQNLISVDIRSSQSDAILTFEHFDGEYVETGIRASNFSARKRVCLYTHPLGIAELFDSAAQDWRGWSGAKAWESIEGELSLSMESDSTGHITLDVCLVNDLGGPDSWWFRAQLTLESGSLDRLSQQVRASFQS